MAGKGGWSPGKDGGKSGSNLTVPGAGGGGGDDKPGKEPRKGNVRYSVTPAAGPMQLWVDSLDLLDGGSRSLPVTPNHPPLIGGSARLMPMRSTPNLMAGAAARLGRRSAPNTPFLNLGMESPEQAQLDQIQLAMSGMTPQQLHQHAQWADDMPEIGLTANPRGTPPFMPTNVQGMLRMGQLGIDSGTVTPEMMRLMGAMMGQQDIGYHGVCTACLMAGNLFQREHTHKHTRTHSKRSSRSTRWAEEVAEGVAAPTAATTTTTSRTTTSSTSTSNSSSSNSTTTRVATTRVPSTSGCRLTRAPLSTCPGTTCASRRGLRRIFATMATSAGASVTTTPAPAPSATAALSRTSSTR